MMELILSALAFLLVAGGIGLTLVFWIGTTRPPGPRSPFGAWLRQMLLGEGLEQPRKRQALIVTGVVGGALVWLLTGWPMGGLLVLVAVPGVPWLFAAAGAEKQALAKLTALEEWTRRVSDYVRNGLGLQAALVAAARTTTSSLITSEVRVLAARLQAGVAAEVALRAFADEFDDYSCDEVVAPLILQLADAGEGLHNALADISEALAGEIASRSMVDTERATARFTVKFLTGCSVSVLVWSMLNSGTASAYRSFLGQTVIFALSVVFVLLMLWIRSLSLPERRPRLLRAHGFTADLATEGGAE
ncbi:type II secretion system F family protein [Hamadaea tsunoensis]|uniref:type II secretion system F family protein n=1 Tax=Hamadaea tsunoensis TaxID=53368 RepID=UPI000416E4E6|nr:type II secretion system F family protein [Hamadaea tsunoensis]